MMLKAGLNNSVPSDYWIRLETYDIYNFLLTAYEVSTYPIHNFYLHLAEAFLFRTFISNFELFRILLSNFLVLQNQWQFPLPKSLSI